MDFEIDILLFNNAGIIQGGYFWEIAPEHIHKTIAVNTLALMHITKEILPGMKERKWISSVNRKNKGT
ncbi:SDR family NAD(P)-dependent oxidoreductase [Shivajiella indica]|uniref:SDR family NAD(P)-dependent oxidoreductase n=1 Tax=Shivajiella indica TaxID=872115 RepID=A0ABW5B5B7_9BACT